MSRLHMLQAACFALSVEKMESQCVRQAAPGKHFSALDEFNLARISAGQRRANEMDSRSTGDLRTVEKASWWIHYKVSSSERLSSSCAFGPVSQGLEHRDAVVLGAVLESVILSTVASEHINTDLLHRFRLTPKPGAADLDVLCVESGRSTRTYAMSH